MPFLQRAKPSIAETNVLDLSLDGLQVLDTALIEFVEPRRPGGAGYSEPPDDREQYDTTRGSRERPGRKSLR